ncbi:unnamed protein product [Rotaria sp. Silwood2]|nr:unnamed protein product [Rotaria sp. Silwood2]
MAARSTATATTTTTAAAVLATRTTPKITTIRSMAGNTWRISNSGEEYSDQDYQESLLEAYDRETTDPRERLQQEQLNELEGFAVLEQIALIQDEIEQTRQIDMAQQLQEEEQQEQNTEQLIHQEL